MKKWTIILLCNLLFIVGFSQKDPTDRKYNEDNICVSKDAFELYELLNNYRKKNRLKPIPLSKALCHVAQVHAEDMEYNMKKLTHAWSTCRYLDQLPKTYDCMWNKPIELTTYKGIGFECAHGGEGNYIATPQSSLSGWQKSRPHNNVILNKDIWKDNTWKAVGVGISGGYATLWFGEEEDKDGNPKVCP